MIQISKGRPAPSGRSDTENRAYDLLDRLGIEYTRADHSPADTMEICADISLRLGVSICKNLFLTNRQQTDFYLLLMPPDKPFKTKFLSKELGVSRLSFGSADQMEALLGVHPGSVSVLGLMNDTDGKVRLVIDSDLLKEEHFGCHPCVNTSSVKLLTRDVTETLLPALGREATYVTLAVEE